MKITRRGFFAVTGALAAVAIAARIGVGPAPARFPAAVPFALASEATTSSPIATPELTPPPRPTPTGWHNGTPPPMPWETPAAASNEARLQRVVYLPVVEK